RMTVWASRRRTCTSPASRDSRSFPWTTTRCPDHSLLSTSSGELAYGQGMKEQAPAVETIEATPVVAPGVAPAGAGAGGAVSQVLRLQATAGNVAVSRALAARRAVAREQ